MKTDKVQTRLSETIITTSDPQQMMGKYLVESVYRKWFEPFLDKDTGEVFEVERQEIVLERGTYLEGEQIAVICFHQQAGDVTEVTVSDQRRLGTLRTGWSVHPYCVTVQLHKKHNLLVLAKNIFQALEIVKDYSELKFDIGFAITSAKEFKHHIFIFDDSVKLIEKEGSQVPQNEVDEEKGVVYVFYSVEVSVKLGDEHESDYRYLVYAKDVDDAKVLIEKDIHSRLEKEAEANGFGMVATHMAKNDIGIVVKSAKQVNCSGVIDREFTEAYNAVNEEE